MAASAASSVLGAIGSAGAKSKAAAQQAYNQTYKEVTDSYNAQREADAAIKNIAALKQREANQKVQINMQRDQSAAAAKVAAAASGSTGSSVDAVANQVDINATYAEESVEQQTRQGVRDQVNQYGSASSAIGNFSPLPETDFTSEFMQLGSSALKIGSSAYNQYQAGSMDASTLDAMGEETLDSLWSK